MEVNKVSQQPNFKGKLTITQYVKNEAGKILTEIKQIDTTAELDKKVGEFCDEYRKNHGFDLSSYKPFRISDYDATKLTEIFDKMTGQNLAEIELLTKPAKRVIDTPKGAVSNRKSRSIDYGHVSPGQNGGINYQLDFNA